MTYTTLAQVKTYLDVSSSCDDALLGDLVARVDTVIDEYVGFALSTDTDSTRSFGIADTRGAYLYFDQKIAAITTVVNNADASSPDTVVSSNYITFPRNETPYEAIKLLQSAGVEWTYTNDPENAIQVTGKWAWSDTTPQDVEHAAARLVSWFYRQRESQGQLDRPLLTGDGVTILPSQIPDDVRSILDRYRATDGAFA